MRKLFSLSILLVVCLTFLVSNNYGQHPIPPGVREAEKQINAQINEPPAKVKNKSADPVQVKQEAEELAKLSAAVPAQMEQVGHGQLPKELADQLKRIEKLAKHLRSEIAP